MFSVAELVYYYCGPALQGADRDKRAESCKFFSAHVYLAPHREVPLECDSALSPNTRMVWLSGREKKFADIFSRLEENGYRSTAVQRGYASRGNYWIILILILILYLKTRNRRA